MGRHRLTGPDGANFLGRVITNCEHKIEFRRTGCGELIPILATCTVRGQVGNFKLMQRLWVNTSRGMTSRAVCSEVGRPFRFMIASAMMERAELPVHRNKTL